MTSAANEDVVVTVVDDIIRLKWTEGVTITEEGCFIFANEAAAALTGRTVPEPTPADARAVQGRRAASSPSVW